MELSRNETEDLAYAVSLLENPGFLIKTVNILGKPVENMLKKMPDSMAKTVMNVTDKALGKAVDFAAGTFDDNRPLPAENFLHKMSVAITGGISGMMGMGSLAVELPVTTTIMLRSILDIAREEGENPADPETRMAALSVFALGGRSSSDDGSETGYYAVRAALSASVKEAAVYLQKAAIQNTADKTAPALIRLMTAIAERFGITVSQKAMAQAVPLIGAAGGAAINTLFMDHFQDMARGHFIVRRLERKYGYDEIQHKYNLIKDEMQKAKRNNNR